MVCLIKVVILISCSLCHVCTVHHSLQPKTSAHCCSQTFPFGRVASFVLETACSSSEKQREVIVYVSGPSSL